MRDAILEKEAKVTEVEKTEKIFYDKEVLKGSQFEYSMLLLSILGGASVLFIVIVSLAESKTLTFGELMAYGYVEFMIGLILIFYGVLVILFISFLREFRRKIERGEEYNKIAHEANKALSCICRMPIIGSYLFDPVRNKLLEEIKTKF